MSAAPAIISQTTLCRPVREILCLIHRRAAAFWPDDPGGLALLATWMLWSFLPAIEWASVLAIATWPLYSIGQRHLGQLGRQLRPSRQLLWSFLCRCSSLPWRWPARAGCRSIGNKASQRVAPLAGLAVEPVPCRPTPGQLVAKHYGRFTEHCRLVGAIGFTSNSNGSARWVVMSLTAI